MLEQMRKISNNIFSKILLSAIAVSFVIWGVGDVFRGRSGHSVAKVGDSEISYEEFNNSLKRELDRYQQMTGKTMTEDQINALNLRNFILSQLVDNKLIKIRVDKLNLVSGDVVAGKIITSEKVFFDESGKFSKERFDQLLKANGINKDQYIDSVKEDASIKIFLDTMAGEPVGMDFQAKELYKYRNEERIVDILELPTSYVKSIPDPSEENLLQYYKENSAQFAVPELREASYIKFGLDNIKSTIKITDEQLKAEYNASIKSYSTPEQRNVEQYSFNKKEEAEAAIAELKANKNAAIKGTKNDMGLVTKDSFPLPEEVSDVVFALPVGSASEPVNTAFGWNIFVVKDVVPGKAKSFAEVKDKIAKSLKESLATQKFSEFSDSIEDEFAAGKTLEDVAKSSGFTVYKVAAIDKNGNGATGKEIKDIPAKDVFLPLVFATSKGEQSALTILPDNSNYIVARVDSVVPERVRALDEVKGTAAQMWKDSTKEKMLKAKMDEVAANIGKGKDMAAIAKELGVKLKTAQKIVRPSAKQNNEDGDAEKTPDALSLSVFTLKKDGVTAPVKTRDGSYVLAKLREIKEPEFQNSKLKNVQTSLRENLVDDVLSQYNTFLRKEYPVSVNKALLEGASASASE